ncbi:MAG: hypothetical protein ACI93B_002129, partial [Yoonia sp.]
MNGNVELRVREAMLGLYCIGQQALGGNAKAIDFCRSSRSVQAGHAARLNRRFLQRQNWFARHIGMMSGSVLQIRFFAISRYLKKHRSIKELMSCQKKPNGQVIASWIALS